MAVFVYGSLNFNLFVVEIHTIKQLWSQKKIEKLNNACDPFLLYHHVWGRYLLHQWEGCDFYILLVTCVFWFCSWSEHLIKNWVGVVLALIETKLQNPFCNLFDYQLFKFFIMYSFATKLSGAVKILSKFKKGSYGVKGELILKNVSTLGRTNSAKTLFAHLRPSSATQVPPVITSSGRYWLIK